MEGALEAMVEAGGLGHRLLDDDTRRLLSDVEALRQEANEADQARKAAEDTRDLRSRALEFLQHTGKDLSVSKIISLMIKHKHIISTTYSLHKSSQN